MKFNKNRFIPINNKNNSNHIKFASNNLNLNQNYNLEFSNYKESNIDRNYISDINNNKNKGIKSLQFRINRQVPLNQNNSNRISNSMGPYQYPNNDDINQIKKINVKKNINLLTENYNYTNPENNEIIINNYTPNYTNFDNSFKNNQKINYQNIPHLKLKKIQFLKQFNTEEQNYKNDNNIYNYTNLADRNIRKNNNNLSSRKKLVINTINNENMNDNYEGNIKPEYDKKKDFHNYLKMGSYFNNSHSKSKKNVYDTNTNYGNRTERIKNRITFDERDKTNSLIVQNRFNKLRKIKLLKQLDEPVENNFYYNNTINNAYNQKELDINNGNNNFDNDYYLTHRPSKESKILDDKINRPQLSSLINSNSKEKNNNKNNIIINNKRPHKNIIIVRKNKNSNNKNILLRISKFNIGIYSNSKPKNENDGLFLIKKQKGKITQLLEINDENIEKMNNNSKEESIILNNSLIKEIDDIKTKNKILEEKLKKMEENSLVFQKKNEELILENEKLKKENESLKKNNINNINAKNNELFEDKDERNYKKFSELKDENGKPKDKKNYNNNKNEEDANIINEN